MTGKKGFILFLLMALFILSLVVGCTSETAGTPEPAGTSESPGNIQPPDVEKISSRFFVMDTLVQITVYAPDQTQGQAAIDQAAAEFQRINDLVGRFPGENLPHPEGSDVYRVNQMAGIAPVQVSDDTLVMIKRAQHFAEMSGGFFNIAIGPLMDLWGFGGAAYHIPTEDELKKVLPLTDYRNILIDDKAKTVYLPEKGMIMDLGGVAKGYATDLAVQKLRASGIKSGIINAGGNVFVLGAKPDGSPWRVGIQDPRNSENIVAAISVTDAAVVSSGDYERYFEESGERYHHIMNPATGKPARGVMGTTIVMNNSTDADICSTLMFVLGPEKGMELQKTLPEMDVVFINDRKEISFSDGLKGKIEFAEQEDYSINQ